MATHAQILANSRNAQKSTGPRTANGKAVVSQNAVKHGLSARCDVISSENQAEFDLYRERMLTELAPVGPTESMLADRIVSLSWRLRRTGRIQNQAIDAMHADYAANPFARLAQSFLLRAQGRPQPDPTDPAPDLTLGRLAIKDFSNARVLDRLLMYERRTEHSLFKTMLELQRLQLIRNLDPLRAGDEQTDDPADEQNPALKMTANHAKQTQFPKATIGPNCLSRQSLRTISPKPHDAKQTQSNPIPKPHPPVKPGVSSLAGRTRILGIFHAKTV